MTGPRRHNGEGSISRRHTATCEKPTNSKGDLTCSCPWRARVQVRVNGQMTRRSLYAPTHAALMAKIDKVKVGSANRTLTDSSATYTVEGWLRKWFEVSEPNWKVKTVTSVDSTIRRYLVPTLGAIRIDRLEADDIDTLIATMRRRGLSNATIRRACINLSTALDMAVDRRRIPYNVVKSVKKPSPTPAGARKGLTVEQALRVLAACGENPRFYVALLCGIRQGEALALRWGDVYLDAMIPYMVIRRSVSFKPQGPDKTGGWVFHTPKSAASTNRVIPLISEVSSRLALLKSRATAEGWGGDDDLVFPGGAGGVRQTHRDWADWGDALKRAGVPHVALHAARNTTAQLLSNAKAQPEIIMQILGHGQLSQTFSYQADNLPGKVAAMAELETYLAGHAVEHAEVLNGPTVAIKRPRGTR